MAFCENCGTELSGTAKFCSSCGKPVVAVAARLTVAPAKKGRRLPKFLLGAAAALTLLAGVVAGTAYYVIHRVSAKAADVAQNLPDVNSIVKTLPSPESQTPANPTTSPSPNIALDPNRVVNAQDGQCALFTKEEVTQALGTNFTHADADATGCTYKGDAPREWVRTEALWKGGCKPVQEKKTAYQQLSHSMPKANIPIQPYSGVGDEAWVNLWNVVTACKGNSGIVIDLRFYHDSDELTKMMANTALSRLRDSKPRSAGPDRVGQ